ncbi:MAG: nucleoside triphosphate pyrophosphohydrolase [Desulfobacterales bacterium]|nr:nucleoside triphosphate pyrophosphohydrolase [Desulfobacterales bacterium]
MGEKKLNTVNALLQLIDTLRGGDGCPWDRKQTPASMAVYLAEETFELIEAIDNGDTDATCEELGDVLFLLLFILRIYDVRGLFNLEAVTERVAAKMVRRHPHVFGDSSADTAGQVRRQWQAIKKTEKAPDCRKSVLDSIPSGLPALLRAYRVSERAAQAGFDWVDLSGVMEKFSEEWAEFNQELGRQKSGEGSPEKLAMEFGDIVFTLANVARFAGFHPETALTGSVNKFTSRFKKMESLLHARGLDMESASPAKLDELWELAKKKTG